MTRSMLLSALVLISVHALAEKDDFVPVCDRSSLVQIALTKTVASCEDATAEELAKITEIEIDVDQPLQPGDLTGLPNLSFVRLVSNKTLIVNAAMLKELPASLSEIEISSSDIELEDGALARFTFLNSLSLEGKIHFPPFFFERLQPIQRLAISGDQIGDSVWSRIARFTQLQTLDLSETGITYVDLKVLKQMPLLSSLTISRNPLWKLDPKIFEAAPNLTHLGISNLELTTLPVWLGRALKNLTSLDIGGNPIQRLDPAFFSSLTSLKLLIIGTPYLTAINKGDFDMLPNLEQLAIVNCSSLDRIDDFAFTNLSHLRSVFFFKTPLRKTRKAAFYGILDVQGLPQNFDQDGAEWGQ